MTNFHYDSNKYNIKLGVEEIMLKKRIHFLDLEYNSFKIVSKEIYTISLDNIVRIMSYKAEVIGLNLFIIPLWIKLAHRKEGGNPLFPFLNQLRISILVEMFRIPVE